MAGHKGPPEVVHSQGRPGRRRRRPSQAGRGTLAQDTPPVLGLLERGGRVAVQRWSKGKQQPMVPCIQAPRESGSLVDPEADSMYAHLERGGDAQKSVNQ